MQSTRIIFLPKMTFVFYKLEMFSRRYRLVCYLQQDVLQNYQTKCLEGQKPSNKCPACFYSLHQPKGFSDACLWCNPSTKCSFMFHWTNPRFSISATADCNELISTTATTCTCRYVSLGLYASNTHALFITQPVGHWVLRINCELLGKSYLLRCVIFTVLYNAVTVKTRFLRSQKLQRFLMLKHSNLVFQEHGEPWELHAEHKCFAIKPVL